VREPANDPIDLGAIAGESGKEVRRASVVIRWGIVDAAAIALALFCALAASAEELTGKVIRVSDGGTIIVLESGNNKHKDRLAGTDTAQTLGGDLLEDNLPAIYPRI